MNQPRAEIFNNTDPSLVAGIAAQIAVEHSMPASDQRNYTPHHHLYPTALNAAQFAQGLLTEHVQSAISAGNHAQRLIQRDSLLDVYSPYGFQMHLKRDLEYAAQHQFPVSLALLYFDSLEHVNNKYGHLAGDKSLEQNSRLLTASIGDVMIKNITPETPLARLEGGDRFAVWLVGLEAQDASNWWEEANHQLTAEGLINYCGTSSQTSQSGYNQASLFMHAEQSLKGTMSTNNVPYLY